MTAADNGNAGNSSGNGNNGSSSGSGGGGGSGSSGNVGGHRDGLRNLVEGLTLSPVTSPISPTSPSSAPLFNHPSQSIFNNPGIGSPASPLLAVPYSNAGARLHSFTPRPRSYSGGGGSPLAIASSSVKAAAVAGGSSGSSTRGTGPDPAVKEVDDPTTPVNHLDKAAAPNTFSRLFATPTPQTTFSRSGRNYSYRGSDSVKLEEFLYTRGFLEGACSDVTIITFGSRYCLHRLILDRSPFFSSCFNGGPWLESTSSEISLSPSDPNITQHAFELALGRLYGHVDRAEEDRHALPLLAAASYLDLQDLAESCASSLLRNLKTSNISTVVRFVTNSYYGPLTDRLMESAKAMLYRDGLEMSFEEWEGISGEVAAEIIGYDGFYVPSEWLRYRFVKEMIDWRICHSFSYNRTTNEGCSLDDEDYDADGASAFDDEETDVKPLRELLENGIYYIHMSFEELQKIETDRDVLGRRTVTQDTTREALWNQMRLRQKVMNVPLNSPDLGITETETIRQPTPLGRKSSQRLPTPRFGEKLGDSGSGRVTPTRQDDGDDGPDGPDTPTTIRGRQTKRKYYIPTEDTTTVIGDCQDTPQHLVVSHPAHRTSTSRSSECQAGAERAGGDEDRDSSTPFEELRYSEFPPFRFSAEFKSVRSLKEKKRVYSKTVFYAGSHWNIYIQKVRSKNLQLGVYLHRAKDRETAGGSHGGSSASRESETIGQVITVDEKIGTLELHTRNTNHSTEGLGDVTVTTDGDVTTSTFTDGNVSGRPGANTSAARSAVPQPSSSEVGVPAVPYYVDSRPMIQTYFKIFSPSRKGKVLSMFSSGPDSFNFSQSWGWKSSSLILEEGMIGGDVDKDARLRFMVVLGNV
ncbi:hypothetical protein C7212DRAFT_301486 [Tuber magnatum]|uniref:BTB domain-containing protein n=1 Tax=Tuber magnatum TaxID=42249 RepID=A0A317SDU4_9PEZI|nr:hypothetical protein C7212DRAFT_301486 [Tuber magnatum]